MMKRAERMEAKVMVWIEALSLHLGIEAPAVIWTDKLSESDLPDVMCYLRAVDEAGAREILGWVGCASQVKGTSYIVADRAVLHLKDELVHYLIAHEMRHAYQDSRGEMIAGSEAWNIFAYQYQWVEADANCFAHWYAIKGAPGEYISPVCNSQYMINESDKELAHRLYVSYNGLVLNGVTIYKEYAGRWSDFKTNMTNKLSMIVKPFGMSSK